MTLFMPKSFTIQFFFNFSNFIGLKMYGRETTFNTSEMGQVIMGLDWREHLCPHGLIPWGEVATMSPPFLQVFPLLSPLCSFPFSSLVCAVTFHHSVKPSKDTFSLRLFLVVFITKWTSPEFSIDLSSSNCSLHHWHWLCNWGMSARVWHKCFQWMKL